jgi:hypothetical protein
MNLKNLLGKTVLINYENIGGIVVEVGSDDVTILRLDGKGWAEASSEDFTGSARALGLKLPRNPTFWWVDATQIVGVITPLSEIVQAEPAPSAIPTTPIEPTAPMTSQVLQMLRKKGDVTSIEAQGVLRCRSLSKRITELKRLGHKINRTLHEDHTGQRYARYILAA